MRSFPLLGFGIGRLIFNKLGKCKLANLCGFVSVCACVRASSKHFIQTKPSGLFLTTMYGKGRAERVHSTRLSIEAWEGESAHEGKGQQAGCETARGILPLLFSIHEQHAPEGHLSPRSGGRRRGGLFFKLWDLNM